MINDNDDQPRRESESRHVPGQILLHRLLGQSSLQPGSAMMMMLNITMMMMILLVMSKMMIIILTAMLMVILVPQAMLSPVFKSAAARAIIEEERKTPVNMIITIDFNITLIITIISLSLSSPPGANHPEST